MLPPRLVGPTLARPGRHEAEAEVKASTAPDALKPSYALPRWLICGSPVTPGNILPMRSVSKIEAAHGVHADESQIGSTGRGREKQK